MKEENKYYVPEIEEFFVGFEVENRLTKHDLWIECITEADLLDNVLDDYEHHPNDVPDLYRVKYLSKQCIEELGFKFEGDKLSKGIQDEFRKGEFILTYHYPSKTLYIETIIEYIVSNITIKSKNELKKLLKQLNIK